MINHIKNIIIVSGSTLSCRMLGLLRDTLLFALLGTSGLNSAFLFAFTIPNLFRRLLGEGALSSAFIPLFSEKKEQESLPYAFHFLNSVLSWLSVVLGIVMVIGMFVFAWMSILPGMEDRWHYGSRLGIFLFPYVWMVCIAAILGAALNVLGVFALPALSAVWLNISMIICMLVASWVWSGLWPIVYGLVIGVIFGGIIQLWVPIRKLMQKGWVFKWDLSLESKIRQLLKLFLPAALGASIFQINVVVNNLLAFYLSEGGVSILYLSNRLVEFPLGLFAVAIHTVIFPNLAKQFAKQDHKGMEDAYSKGLVMILMITLPASLGLISMSESILGFLFEWGRFNAVDVKNTLPVLNIFSLGIPFYALASFSTRGFHALKDTKTPFKISLCSFFVNISLAIMLMKPYGVIGLALASFLATVFQSIVLQCILGKKVSIFCFKKLITVSLKILFASLMIAILSYIVCLCVRELVPYVKIAQWLCVSCVIPLCMLVYIYILIRLNVLQVADIQVLIKKIFKKQ